MSDPYYYYVKEDDAAEDDDAAPFPQNEAVQVVWALFGIFWGSLVCLYAPLCCCEVPYTGPRVDMKKSQLRTQMRTRRLDVVDEAKYRFGYKSNKKGRLEDERLRQIAEQERMEADIPDLIKHMYCNQNKENPTNDVVACWDSVRQQDAILEEPKWIQEATEYLQNRDLNAAKEAWNRQNTARLKREREEREHRQKERDEGPLLDLPP
jgi:hypothetical protein